MVSPILAMVLGTLAASPEVEAGWEQAKEGGWVYIIRLDPQYAATLSLMRQAVDCDVPAQMKDIRRIQIRIGGNEKLARPDLPRDTATALVAAEMVPVVPSRPTARPAETPPIGGFQPPQRAPQGGLGLPGGRPVAATDAPRPIQADPGLKPVPTSPDVPEQPLTFKTTQQQHLASRPALSGSPSAEEPKKDSTAEANHPWMPLTLALGFLVASLSANLYLGWLYVDARNRYQTLLRKQGKTRRRRERETVPADESDDEYDPDDR